jgi:addiction module HigA family antidote
MTPTGLSANALSKAISVPLPRVRAIMRQTRRISAEMAVLLSAYFGTTDSFWQKLQTHYDLEMARKRMKKLAARIKPHPHDSNGVLKAVRARRRARTRTR